MIARELAESLDCSESTVSRLLSGERRPSLETMRDIKLVLGWTIEDQAEALELDQYPAQLKLRMERQPGAQPCAQ